MVSDGAVEVTVLTWKWVNTKQPLTDSTQLCAGTQNFFFHTTLLLPFIHSINQSMSICKFEVLFNRVSVSKFSLRNGMELITVLSIIKENGHT